MLIGKYLNEIMADPYFHLILLGAVVWYIGLLMSFLGTPAVTLGFTLTCFATTAYALKRPTDLAWPGVVVGVIIHFIGLWAIGIRLFMGAVIPKTNVTAMPRPTAVSTFLDTARNEHIPRKKARAILLMNTHWTNKLM